jgi:uncharacterized protein
VPVNIRPLQSADHAAVLALNAQWVHFLSPLSPQRLEHLQAQSALALVAEAESGVVAFLLAFREDADYDSINYRWFCARYPRFLYIDRVVVAARSGGVGTQLYRHVFTQAAQEGVPIVTCEIDVDPPNPVSEQFHRRFGFAEVGRQAVAEGTKTVSLQVANS